MIETLLIPFHSMHYIPDEPELSHVGGNTIGGNPDTFYPQLWAWLVLRLNISSVLDVGCGEGHALREFKRLGCSVFGIDGAPRNADIAKKLVASEDICAHDLTKNAYILQTPPDLIWSCEVIGQIEIQFIQNVLRTLSQGHYLALTHQLPGQDGTHHVNLRPPEFWRAALFDAGMEVNEKLTLESKKVGRAYWSHTGTIFQRRA